jgi:hypothetical protein
MQVAHFWPSLLVLPPQLGHFGGSFGMSAPLPVAARPLEARQVGYRRVRGDPRRQPLR